MIHGIDSGLVFRNPAPHLRAVNAWHPTLLALPGGDLLCTFDLGQGAESFDYHTVISRSADGGRKWSPPRAVLADPLQPTTHTLRIARLPNGRLLGLGARWRRDDPDKGLTNRQTFGMLPMDVIATHSDDDGATWTPPRVIEPPLVGPAFEVCHSPVTLTDGRVLWSTSTLRGWHGDAPSGTKAVAFISRDGGQTFAGHIDVIAPGEHVIPFEQSLVELPGGRLLALAWAFDEATGTSRTNLYAVSDNGVTFGPPRDTGLSGETAKLLALDAERLLCVYRNTRQPGLWACIVRLGADGAWVMSDHVPLWQGAQSRMSGAGTHSDNLAGLKFGYPSLTRAQGDEVLVAFWCLEDAVYNIRLLRVAVGG